MHPSRAVKLKNGLAKWRDRPKRILVSLALNDKEGCSNYGHRTSRLPSSRPVTASSEGKQITPKSHCCAGKRSLFTDQPSSCHCDRLIAPPKDWKVSWTWCYEAINKMIYIYIPPTKANFSRPETLPMRIISMVCPLIQGSHRYPLRYLMTNVNAWLKESKICYWEPTFNVNLQNHKLIAYPYLCYQVVKKVLLSILYLLPKRTELLMKYLVKWKILEVRVPWLDLV